MPEQPLPIRIVLVAPPPDVAFCVGSKRAPHLIQQVRSTGMDLTFEVVARVKDGRLLGNEIHGSPAARFVYICSGTSAGDPTSCWTRRAKVPLTGITSAMMSAGRTLEARISGLARDGGPACASVPLLGTGWRSTC